MILTKHKEKCLRKYLKAIQEILDSEEDVQGEEPLALTERQKQKNKARRIANGEKLTKKEIIG